MFHNDMYRMLDFITNNKEDFINIHPHITGLEYDLTHDYFYLDIVNNCVKLYEEVNNCNSEVKNHYLMYIDKFIKKLPKQKQEQIKELLKERG